MKVQWLRWSAMAMVLVALAGVANAADFTLVRDGKAAAVIVTADEPAPTARGAAAEFQQVVKQMTGAELSIVGESAYDGKTPPVLIGQSKLALEKGFAIPQHYESGDHYVVRVADNFVALVGNDDGDLLGSSYAAFDLLQRLGCGWFTPDPVWHVIPRSQTLTASAVAVEERPVYQMRQIWMVQDPIMQRAWRLGGIRVPANHNFHHLIPPGPPENLKEKHPDWFGPGQPCLTHPEVQRHIIAKLRTEIDASPLKVTRLSISPNDTDEFCQCERCRAVGNISARMMKFSHAIADGLRETHAGRFELLFLAYWVTHGEPDPMIKGPKELNVMIVNEGDHAHPLDAPVPDEHAKKGRNNRREQLALDGWSKTGSLTAMYEWWIPGCSVPAWRSVPWYSGETALRNLRYWQKRGIRYITYETQYENGNGFPIRWPLYYMGARGSWDTSLKADDVMREACAKLYGSAAEPMFAFYRTLEMAMLNTKESGGNWSLPSAELIYTPDIEDEATAHLAKAAGATKDPEALARVAAEQKMWTQARQTLAQLRGDAGGAKAFTVKLDDKTAAWREATINEKTIRDLFDLKADAMLTAVEPDGQTRAVNAGETFDLRGNVVFRTTPPSAQ